MDEAQLVEELRAAVTASLEEASLRSVARAVGLSPTGLKKFVEGTIPYRPMGTRKTS